VFSGRAGPLNRLIFEILRSKKVASYDIYLEVRRVKGFKHKKYQAVDRRIKKLVEQGWLIVEGTKTTKPGTEASLYRLSSGGPTALEVDKVSMNRFLSEANDEMQMQMTKLLASFRERLAGTRSSSSTN
jgi:hypothetical protein